MYKKQGQLQQVRGFGYHLDGVNTALSIPCQCPEYRSVCGCLGSLPRVWGCSRSLLAPKEALQGPGASDTERKHGGHGWDSHQPPRSSRLLTRSVIKSLRCSQGLVHLLVLSTSGKFSLLSVQLKKQTDLEKNFYSKQVAHGW